MRFMAFFILIAVFSSCGINGNIKSSSDALTASAASGPAFLNGGNSFGADSKIGNLDNQGLAFLTSGLPRITILADGRVGVGTTTPKYHFEVRRDDNTTMSMVVNNSSTVARYPQMHVQNYAGNTAGYPQFVLMNSRGDSVTSSPLLTNDVLGSLTFRGGRDVVPGYSHSGANIIAYAAEDYSPTAGGAHLAFETIANGTDYRQERLRITESGKIGIGTAAPSEKLDVNGNLKVSGQISSQSQVIAGGGSTIDWSNGNTIRTDYNCASNLTFNNLRDGGTYTLIVTSTGTAQCNFGTSTGGSDAGTVSYRFMPYNMPRVASSYTVYTLLRTGSVVLVSWVSGY